MTGLQGEVHDEELGLLGVKEEEEEEEDDEEETRTNSMQIYSNKNPIPSPYVHDPFPSQYWNGAFPYMPRRGLHYDISLD